LWIKNEMQKHLERKQQFKQQLEAFAQTKTF
jgi:hypothetical protein